MKNTIETLKQLGENLRSSNPGHQTALRNKLAERAIPATPVRKTIPLKHIMFLGAWATAGLAVIFATRPAPASLSMTAMEPSRDDFYELEDRIVATLDNVGAAAEMAYAPRAPMKAAEPVNDGAVVQYVKENGSMLETTTTISLMSTKKDLSTEVEKLFTSLGGHVSSIATRTAGQQTITGLVPADSYFLFKEHMRDLVSADRYMFEILNAQDLAPSAVTVSSHIGEATKSIDALKKQIADTKDENTKASLERQLASLETQRENLHKSLSSLNDRATYATVSVNISEIPNFWKARSGGDFKKLVAGFENPSYFQQAWINVLTITAQLLQVFSVTFWLLIPLGIWLASRARTRRAWKALE